MKDQQTFFDFAAEVALVMHIRNPAYRAFVKGVRGGGVVPENLAEYFGYGMYVGRKG